MALDYKREIIGDGIGLNIIRDDKFKTCSVKISFITALNKKTATACSLVSGLVSNSSKNYPDKTKFSQKLASLYGATFGGTSAKMGDNLIVTFVGSTIRSEYALDGEKLDCELAQLVCDSVLSPNVSDDSFAEPEFSIRKQELIDSIDAVVNEKRGYAVKQAYETVFCNEPFAVNTVGDRDEAVAIDSKAAFEAYKKLVEESEIEITVAGGGSLDNIAKIVKERFSSVKRNPVKTFKFNNFSPAKAETARVCEPMEVNQSKMVMAYKSDYGNIYVCKFMSAMLGGTAFSKLFTNVREKLSLCYYCAARYVDGKGTLIIDSGVDLKNVELAQKAINEQLADLANGNFSDELMENTRLTVYGDIRSSFDSVAGIMSWYLTHHLRGDNYTREQVMEIEKNITREQIIECAKSFKQDTVYILESKSQKAAEE